MKNQCNVLCCKISKSPKISTWLISGGRVTYGLSRARRRHLELSWTVCQCSGRCVIIRSRWACPGEIIIRPLGPRMSTPNAPRHLGLLLRWDASIIISALPLLLLFLLFNIGIIVCPPPHPPLPHPLSEISGLSVWSLFSISPLLFFCLVLSLFLVLCLKRVELVFYGE